MGDGFRRVRLRAQARAVESPWWSEALWLSGVDPMVVAERSRRRGGRGFRVGAFAAGRFPLSVRRRASTHS